MEERETVWDHKGVSAEEAYSHDCRVFLCSINEHIAYSMFSSPLLSLLRSLARGGGSVISTVLGFSTLLSFSFDLGTVHHAFRLPKALYTSPPLLACSPHGVGHLSGPARLGIARNRAPILVSLPCLSISYNFNFFNVPLFSRLS